MESFRLGKTPKGQVQPLTGITKSSLAAGGVSKAGMGVPSAAASSIELSPTPSKPHLKKEG